MLGQKENLSQNLSPSNQFMYPYPMWTKMIPYFLYFIITLIVTVYIYLPHNSPRGGFINLDFRSIAVFFIWGMFVSASVSYFVVRKYFFKKRGFKYSILVFFGNIPFTIILYYIIYLL